MKLHVKSKQCIGENAQKYNEKLQKIKHCANLNNCCILQLHKRYANNASKNKRAYYESMDLAFLNQ